MPLTLLRATRYSKGEKICPRIHRLYYEIVSVGYVPGRSKQPPGWEIQPLAAKKKAAGWNSQAGKKPNRYFAIFRNKKTFSTLDCCLSLRAVMGYWLNVCQKLCTKEQNRTSFTKKCNNHKKTIQRKMKNWLFMTSSLRYLW